MTRRAQFWIGEDTPPRETVTSQASTAILVALHYPDRVHRLVVKSPRLDTQQFGTVMRAVIAGSPGVHSYFPGLRDVDDDFVVFDHVDGEVFLNCLERDARQVTGGSEPHLVLRQLAEAMARVHRLTAVRVGLNAVPVPNQHFISTFTQWSRSFSAAFRGAGFGDSTRFVERLGHGFLSRLGDRVLIGDSQPKNVIVRPDGSPCFIDLDWLCGPPAMSVALFLVALDRFAARHPGRRVLRRIAGWKRSFVEAYREHGEDSDIEDLLLFYPWAVMQTCDRHTSLRQWLGPYFRWHYNRPLAQFLNSLSANSVRSAIRDPGLLFEHGT